MNVSSKIKNKNIIRIQPVITPKDLQKEFSVSDNTYNQIFEFRNTIKKILNKEDNRFLIILGPCSIHDKEATLEFAKQLAKFQKEFQENLFLVMRLYFEKPRTSVGWRGLIVEPELDGFPQIENGLKRAREIAYLVSEVHLPIATEFLDPAIPQYLSDLVSWASVGARSSESQIHRELASALSMPVGFKNATDGNIETAINAIYSSKIPHAFLGITENGNSAIIHSSGNPDSHLVLRGSDTDVNYDKESIKKALNELAKADLPQRLIVDCSHGNSHKKAVNQIQSFNSVLETKLENTPVSNAIVGVMLESFLQTGSTEITNCKDKKNFGLSITDECLGIEETYSLLKNAFIKLNSRK